MKLIEQRSDLERFLKVYRESESILIPISSDENKHPKDTTLCLLYVQLLKGDEYMLSFNHSESINIDIPDLSSPHKKYTFDRKRLNHFLDLENVIDVNLIHYMDKGVPYQLDDVETSAHNFLNMRFYKKQDVNTIIPIMKHLESCRKISDIIKDNIQDYDEYVNLSYNDDIINNLTYIESNGIQTTNKMLFSEYNMYTSTGRPSNRFGGTNFAALNKKDGSRKQFVSRFENGMLVEMDFDAYHLRLIADRVNYDFGKGSVHEHMAKLYNVDYEEAKRLSFQYLYGFLPQEVIQMNAYFGRVHDYINEIWSQFELNDFIESDIYNRRMYKRNLENDITANKLFNYTIQQMETENNMKVLTELIPNIKEYKSKLILYSYDSFLFDFNLDDGLDYLKKIKVILEQDGKYPVKVSRGVNYHEMKDITEKFV